MVTLSLAEFADRINQILPQVIKNFTKNYNKGFLKVEITPPQLVILDVLQQAGEIKMTDLARFLKVTTAAATGLVERLVKSGYAFRVYDPKDRRIIRIKITSKGSYILKKINQQRRQMIMDVFGKLSELDRQQYLNILTRIQEILIREEATK